MVVTDWTDNLEFLTSCISIRVDSFFIIFNVTGVGIVVAGDLISGKIYTNDKLFVGPDYSGKYYPVTVRSIHIKRVPVLSASSGTYVCLALKKITRKMLRIGQVVVSTGKLLGGTGQNTTGSGFIRINANPNDQYSPYIDIVERTGSDIYAVELKTRLGDLSGVAGTRNVPSNFTGFGLMSENVFI